MATVAQDQEKKSGSGLLVQLHPRNERSRTFFVVCRSVKRQQQLYELSFTWLCKPALLRPGCSRTCHSHAAAAAAADARYTQSRGSGRATAAVDVDRVTPPHHPSYSIIEPYFCSLYTVSRALNEVWNDDSQQPQGRKTTNIYYFSVETRPHLQTIRISLTLEAVTVTLSHGSAWCCASNWSAAGQEREHHEG